MSAWPVIVRELRAEARRPANYWLRVIGAGLVLLIALANLSDMTWGPGASGRPLFATLHWCLFAAICVTVPLLTADCISSERREGTLGLLFLTPLSPAGLMAGKSAAHALRALMLVLVAVPVMAVAFVLGGVTRLDLFNSLGMNLAALCLALAGGLIATVWARERVRALILAEILTLCLVWFYVEGTVSIGRNVWRVFGPIAGTSLSPGQTTTTGPVPTRAVPPMPAPGGVLIINGTAYAMSSAGPGGSAGWVVAAPRTPSWPRLAALVSGAELFPGIVLANAPPGARELWLLMLVISGLSAVAVLRASIWFGGKRLRSARQEEPPSARQLWMHRTFCTPAVLARGFRRRMAGMLDRNPIGWLQHYSWSARLTKWGWCALIAVTYSVRSFDSFLEQQPFVLAAFAAGIAFAAANSFRRERQSGALELLLVTPLRERQIVNGRLMGLWWQFLPALAIWWAGYLTITPLANNWWQNGANHPAYDHIALMIWLTIPVIGLRASLRWRNLFTVWLVTILAGLAFPWFVLGIFTPAQSLQMAVNFTPMFVTQAAVAMACYSGMVSRLRSREFAF